MSRRLLLVRHGVTDWNREGRFQGRRDPPLAESGRREAELLAGRLAADLALRPARIVSSPQARALETARILAGGGEVVTDGRLAEIGQGEWEGRTHAELEIADAARYRAWRASGGIVPPPGGEPRDAVRARVPAALAEALADPARPLCLVSHGGVIRLAAAFLLAIDERVAWRFDVDNATLGVLVEAEGAWRIERWNDARHLLGRAPLHVDEEEGEPLAL